MTFSIFCTKYFIVFTKFKNFIFVFIPSANEIYFKKRKRKIVINKKYKILCSKFRKGHFEGVLNVMNRLMKIIKAKRIFMGEKDFQQLFLIKKYLSKKFKIKIINCPIIRDRNKVALSTRNKLLSKKNYKKASLIAKYLTTLKNSFNIDNKNLSIILRKNIAILEDSYKIKVDYLELRNENDLSFAKSTRKFRLFIAYNIGDVRLIDNF